MNQDNDLEVEVRRGKETKLKAPSVLKGQDWLFGLASPFIRAWHRHRVLLACATYGWVSDWQARVEYAKEAESN